MLFIGITGGAGAGKSEILNYIEKRYRCRVMIADRIAHDLTRPRAMCYGAVRELFSGEEVFFPDGRIDRPALARLIFSDREKRDALDAIVHPAVKEYVLQKAALERERQEVDLLAFEAALLVEEGYDALCDELWYIHSSKENRRRRLKTSRGYPDEKIDAIFESQLSEEEFRAACAVRIENNALPQDAFRQIDALLFGKARPKAT